MIVISGILFLSGYDLFPTSFDTLPMELYDIPYKLRDLAYRDKAKFDNKFTRAMSDTGFANWERGLMFSLSSIDVYFDTDNGNVFTKENLQIMKRMEDDVVTVSEYKTKYCQTKTSALDCKVPVSIIRYFDGTYSSINAVFNDPNFNNIVAVLYEAYTNNQTKTDFEYFLPKTFILTSTQASATHTRLIIPIGCSLTGDLKCGDTASEATKPFLAGNMKDKLEHWRESVSSMHVYYYAYNLWVQDVINQAMTDMKFALGSMMFIFGFMVFHTRSLWISGFAIMSIISSFLGGNLIYRCIIDFQYFGFFHILAIFIVLGIGADDLFVFYDAWRLTAFESYPSLGHRLSDAYSKSAFSMMITSLTTMVAFLSSALSPLLATKSFGVFSAIVVLFNFISVITFFPTVIIMYHLKFEAFKWPCIQCCKRKCRRGQDSSEKDKKEHITHNSVTPVHDKSYDVAIIENGISNGHINGIDDHVGNGSVVGNGHISSKGSSTVVKLITKEPISVKDTETLKPAQKTKKKQKKLVIFFRDYYFKFVTHKMIRFCVLPVFMITIAFFSYQASQLEPDNENVSCIFIVLLSVTIQYKY